MKSRLIFAFACALTAVTASAAAKTWYVDDDWYEQGGDGTIDAPFGTIQEAIDAAAKNDIIKVKPGTYNKGSVQNTNGTDSHNSRVVVSKVLTIESTDGAAVTHIVGAADPTTGGTGTGAVRCMITTNAVTGAVVRGFTLRDGFGGNAAAGQLRAGAYGQISASSSGGKYPCFESCVVSNCTANTYGAVHGGTWVRCLFTGNKTTRHSYDNPTTAYSANMAHCIIVANGDGLNDSAIHGCNLLNCTVVGNAGFGLGGSESSKFRNCVVCQNSKGDINPGDKGPKDLAGCALGDFLVASPFFGDYRVVAGRAADGCGSYSYLDTDAPFTVPNGVSLLTDFNGAEIVADTNGKIHAGAVQSSAAVTSGALVFVGPFTFGGKTVLSKYACLPAQATAETVSEWQVKPAETMEDASGNVTYLNRLDRSGGSDMCVFPDMNDVFTLMPPPVGVVCTNAFVYSKGLWVNSDPNVGSDTANNGSEGSPYETIQKAVDVGGASTVIFVAPGTYRDGVTGEAGSGAPTYGRNRLVVTPSGIRIRSTGTAANTFLVGEADETTGGPGPNAVRCFRTKNTAVALQGFTLSNGHAADSTVDTTNCRYGAAAYGTDGTASLLDCVIDGCHGSEDIVRNLRLYRCELKNNVSDNNSIHSNGGFEWGCWSHDNTSKSGDYYGYVGSGAAAYRCTLVTDSETQNPLFSRSATIYNTVALCGQQCKADMKQGGNVLWDFKYAIPEGLSCTIADPLLCPGEPYAVSAASPVFGAGVSLTNFWEMATSDFDGQPIAWAGDTFVAGAVSCKSPRPWALIRETNGALDPAGYVSLTGDTYLRANADSERPCIGYTANGVTNLFADEPAPLTVAEAATHGYVIEPICTDVWYVGGQWASDQADGFSPKSAKLTLAGVLSCAKLRSGDTVKALPGVYATGKMLHKDNVAVASRAVVPAGVTLESTDGAAVTEIVGESDLTTPDVCPYPTKTTDPRGCGPKAVRCVALMKNAKIVGFTLRAGRTRIDDDEGVDLHYNADCSGAGVLGVTGNRDQATVERCILRDNISFRGGAARYCTLVDCEIATNFTFYGAAAGQTCDFYGCYIHDNEDIGYPGREILGVNVFENCTVLDDVSSLTDITVGHAFNSLFLGKSVSSNDYYRSCAFTDSSGVSADVLDETSIIASADELQLAEGRPVVGANLAINQADETIGDIPPGETDLTGFPRVTDGRRDIGALEADWRPTYAAKLGNPKYVSVPAAGPQVVSETGGVVVKSGSLDVAVAGRDGSSSDYSLDAEVTGSGTLTVTLNGELLATLTEASGKQTLTFKNALEENALSFAYTPGDGDTGAALISAIRRMSGFMIYIP